MADNQLVSALHRLDKAVQLLEAAGEHRSREAARTQAMTDSVQALQKDRKALAEQLDDAQAQAKRLMDANKIASDRLVSAMETIRGVLGSQNS